MNALPFESLVFERRIKGHLPVTRFAVSDSGEVTIAVPDGHQPRLHHIVRFATSGEWSEGGRFSVEKLRSMDLSRDARTFAASTDDDVYVFREGVKTRFFADRRDIYASISLSESGELLVTGSSDMLNSSYSVTLVKTSGAVEWVRDVPFAITCARISADGSRILVASEEGVGLMMDRAHSDVWRLESGDPITAMAVSYSGDRAVIGSRFGAVRALGDVGNVLWEVAREGAISDCATSGDGRLIVTARDVSSGGSVECFYDGAPIVERQTAAGVLSVACSEDGAFVAVSCADGLLQVLEIGREAVRSCSVGTARLLRDEGLTALQSGDHASSVELLTRYLEIQRGDADACRALIRAREGLAAARNREISEALADAESLAQAGRLDDALTKAGEIIELDFTNLPARELMSRVQDELGAKCLADADEAMSGGDFVEAVRLLERAASVADTSEIRERLAQARAKQALAEGLALYDAKKFAQAVFQFRKVLTIEPENEEARKHLEYAEGLRQDDMIFDRFSKLE